VDLFGAINIKGTRDDINPNAYHHLKNPALAYIQLAGSAEERDSYFIENFLYGDVYQARFDNVSHNAFTSNYVARNHYFKDKLPNGHNVAYVDTVDACYKNVCRYTLEMLNAYIKNDQSAMTFLNSNPSENGLSNLQYFKRKGITAPPTPDQFIKIARTQGVAQAKQIYNDVRSTDKYWKLFKENQMNVLGYQLLGNGNMDDAIEVFTLISLEYPNSWNAFDSLGEAWLKKGNKELAKKYLEKSVDLLPQNTHAIELLRQL
jgi:tetratricopeptide (TPR) repeat protein